VLFRALPEDLRLGCAPRLLSVGGGGINVVILRAALPAEEPILA